uniref:Pr1-like protein n=1 Tax=Globodera pallida TaxID=36090 RepID=A0A183CB92_GLOPA
MTNRPTDRRLLRLSRLGRGGIRRGAVHSPIFVQFAEQPSRTRRRKMRPPSGAAADGTAAAGEAADGTAAAGEAADGTVAAGEAVAVAAVGEDAEEDGDGDAKARNGRTDGTERTTGTAPGGSTDRKTAAL